jgi:hypothetical protein
VSFWLACPPKRQKRDSAPKNTSRTLNGAGTLLSRRGRQARTTRPTDPPARAPRGGRRSEAGLGLRTSDSEPDSDFGLGIRTRRSDSDFGLGGRTRNSDSEVGLGIRTRRSDSDLGPRIRTWGRGRSCRDEPSCVFSCLPALWRKNHASARRSMPPVGSVALSWSFRWGGSRRRGSSQSRTRRRW